MIELNKKYTTKGGSVIRIPLVFSQCNRFVYCKVIYTCGKINHKHYFKNARQFEHIIAVDSPYQAE